MKYYLLDEEKIRRYLETKIVNNEVQTKVDNILGQIVSFKLKNVTYEILSQSSVAPSLSLYKAIPSEDNPYALTTEGFVEWKNHTKQLSAKKTKIIPLERFFLDYAQFCSSYICIGTTPPKDVINIRPEKIKFYEIGQSIEGSVEEKEDKLIMKVKYLHSFEIGVEDNGMSFLIMSVDDDDFFPQYVTIIIPKGTCFVTKKVVKESNSYYIEDKRVALCYD